MLEFSSLSNSDENLIKNQASNSQKNSFSREISASNKQEFQNLVNKMILGLIARTETDISTILSITQEYQETASNSQPKPSR
jgi:hypothetical protein